MFELFGQSFKIYDGVYVDPRPNQNERKVEAPPRKGKNAMVATATDDNNGDGEDPESAEFEKKYAKRKGKNSNTKMKWDREPSRKYVRPAEDEPWRKRLPVPRPIA